MGCALVLILIRHPVMSQTPPIQPPPPVLTVPVVVSVQVNERGWAREEERRQNGGLHEEEEEEATPKQHRKPERTLRYADAITPGTASSGELFIKLYFQQSPRPNLLPIKNVCPKKI